MAGGFQSATGGGVIRVRAYRTELDPTNAQRTAFMRHAGAARFIYNWALADRIAAYESGHKSNLYEQKRRFNAEKDTICPWIRSVAYVATQEAFANLDVAYQNFFRRVKAGEKPGFPRFKSRHRSRLSFRMRGSIHVEANRIKLPVIGWVRLQERGYLPTDDAPGTRLLNVGISERAGRWYVSAQVVEEVPDIEPATGAPVGLDLGIKSLAVLSDGTVFENPKSLMAGERKLKRLSRELARRQKGSKNREKTRRQLVRCHARIANIRAHSLHQVSHHVTAKTKPAAVVVEDLNVKGMTANHSLAKAVSDASFGELRRQIGYKASWHGVEVVVADRFYPSSKTCSACGSVKPTLALSERTFVCPECGVMIDRDLNAAINLASLAGA
jgi:putative transposase